MSVQVGSTYRNTSGNLVLIVLSMTSLTARCAVLWANEDVCTAYRAGDADNWPLKLIEKYWTLVS